MILTIRITVFLSHYNFFSYPKIVVLLDTFQKTKKCTWMAGRTVGWKAQRTVGQRLGGRVGGRLGGRTTWRPDGRTAQRTDGSAGGRAVGRLGGRTEDVRMDGSKRLRDSVQAGVEYRGGEVPITVADKEVKRSRTCAMLEARMFSNANLDDTADMADPETRKHAFEWGVAFQNSLLVITGKGLKRFVVTEYAMKTADPEELEGAHTCIDQGGDGWCMVQYLAESSLFSSRWVVCACIRPKS